jgi:hypothetical protein
MMALTWGLRLERRYSYGPLGSPGDPVTTLNAVRPSWVDSSPVGIVVLE